MGTIVPGVNATVVWALSRYIDESAVDVPNTAAGDDIFKWSRLPPLGLGRPSGEVYDP
jgi:hypothetical protein